MLFFLCSNLFLSQTGELSSSLSSAITITGDAMIYNSDQIIVINSDPATNLNNKLDVHEGKLISPLKRGNKKIAKASFKKEMKEKEEKLKRFAENLQKKINNFFVQNQDKDFCDYNLREYSACSIITSQNQKFSGTISEVANSIIKSNGEIYSRKVFYDNTHLHLLNFSRQFSVRPPPTNPFA